MVRDTLTGSRIRERRSIAGLRQADLARQIGISASYLNLIEHNRRRINPALLDRIAGALDIETEDLAAGGNPAVISDLILNSQGLTEYFLPASRKNPSTC